MNALLEMNHHIAVRPHHTQTLILDKLTYANAEKKLFSSISVILPPATLLHIQGPNGSGKTTLLQLIAQWHTPASGKIIYGNEHRSLHALKHAIHFIGHSYGLHPSLTIKEYWQWLAQLYSPQFSWNELHLADQFGLTPVLHLPCRMLSAGQKKRVTLAGLVITHRPLWLLDEPFTHLDKKGTATLQPLLNQHIKAQGTILITSHQNLPFIEAQKKINLILRVSERFGLHQDEQ